MKLRNRRDYRVRRHMRLRKKISGTADRPRMSLMKSSRHMYVQFIDDDNGVTLASATTSGSENKCNVEIAGALGKRAAEAALGKGIKSVVVDRGGFPFHGRIKAVVDAAVEAGLKIRSGDEPVAAVADDKEEK